MARPSELPERSTSLEPATGEITAMVRDLVELMVRGGLTKLDLSFGDVSIRLRGRAAARAIAPAVEPVSPAFGDGLAAPSPREHLITAPMIGTYYASSSPGSPPFVRVGDPVERGQVVGIIEAMKIMNEIVADRDGVVVELLVTNGQPVEYGSPLVRLALDEDEPA